MQHETDRIEERYRRRDAAGRYNPLRPDVYMTLQERQRRLAELLRTRLGPDLSATRVLEVGCGAGSNLLELIALGVAPEHIVGNDLLPDRVEAARRRLPAAVQLHGGDALAMDLPDASFDLVYQSTVFSSILDGAFRAALASRMWRWVRPGGAVLWYDFTVDNPSNRDVRGVRRSEVRALFPQGEHSAFRVTLAPPIARLVTRLHPSLYTLVNVLPLLRTHLLCWIRKT